MLIKIDPSAGTRIFRKYLKLQMEPNVIVTTDLPIHLQHFKNLLGMILTKFLPSALLFTSVKSSEILA